MSLILDALRKLERDKERPDPGVVVLGPAPWPGLRSSRRGWIVGLLAAAAVLAVAFTWLTRARTPGPDASSAPAAAASPVPMPSPRTPQAVAATAAAPVSGAPAAARAADLGPPAGRRLVLPDAVTAADTTAAGRQDAKPVQRDLQLMAISERDGRPIAIVSDHLVREGDSFDGVKIIRIGETEVEVEQHGRRRVLRF